VEWSKLDSLVDKCNKVGDIRTRHGIDRIFQLARKEWMFALSAYFLIYAINTVLSYKFAIDAC
jgi:hypothetical protein